MSLSPVLGRSRMLASLYSGRYLRRIFICTVARPFSSVTLPISPTFTPAMFTVWPWPGTTAWALDSTASTSTKSEPITGTHSGG